MRNDIHRPSAIIPADYDFVGFRYDGNSPDELHANVMWRREIADHMDRTGGQYSFHDHGGSCHVCGARALYLGIFHHRPTNAYVCVGEDCADKLGSGNWDAFRSSIKRGKEAATGKAKAMQYLADLNMSEAWGVYDGAISVPSCNAYDTLCDVVSKLVQYGSISAKQEDLIRKLLVTLSGAAERQAQYAAKAAASQWIGEIGKRDIFSLTVKFVTGYETQFGYCHVFGFEDQSGNVVIYKGSSDLKLERGRSCEIKATVKDHGLRDGNKQTIIARPQVMAG
jgi:hypothetical protein